MLAAQSGNTSLVGKLLEAGASIDRQDARGFTALTGAAFSGHADVVSLLLKRGARQLRDTLQRTVLMWTASKGQVEIIELLLAAGAEINAADARGTTALMLALGKVDALEALLSAGAAVDQKDSRGFTALMSAAWTGRVKAARRLLEHGAGIDVRDDKTGRTALMWAAVKGHAAFVRMLLDAGADPALLDNEGHDAVKLAGKYRHKAIVELLAGSEAAPGPNEGRSKAMP